MTTNEELNKRLNKVSWKERFKSVAKFSDLKGKTITSIEGAEVGNDVIWFTCSDGSEYVMYHEQDCCESVEIEDVSGDINDLIGTPITLAADISNEVEEAEDNDEYGSHTWTWYNIATVKGYVTIRWYGESNGYYSESVDFIKLKESDSDKLPDKIFW